MRHTQESIGTILERNERLKTVIVDRIECIKCGQLFGINCFEYRKKVCTDCRNEARNKFGKRSRKNLQLPSFIFKNSGVCFYCGSSIGILNKHLDHIIPTSRGGLNVPENQMAICSSCNLSKSDMAPWEYIKALTKKAFKDGYDKAILEWRDEQPKRKK
jgi:5-methylcytosine-specific restriction endonuclease McrA